VAATTILLVRHGETDWNRDRRIQGHTDVALNESGRRQARALAAELDGGEIAAVYSSDLARALETASIVAAPRGLAVTVTAELRERDFGTWEGLSDAEAVDRFPDLTRGPWDTWGDGESSAEMTARALAAVHAIVSSHPFETVLVVTHGGPIRAVLRSFGAEDGRIENCAVVRLVAEGAVLRRVD
jgi:broad specificity phosphatase PhoE